MFWMTGYIALIRTADATTAVIKNNAVVILSEDIRYILSGKFIHSSSFSLAMEDFFSIMVTRGRSILSSPLLDGLAGHGLTLFHHYFNHIAVKRCIVW